MPGRCPPRSATEVDEAATSDDADADDLPSAYAQLGSGAIVRSVQKLPLPTVQAQVASHEARQLVAGGGNGCRPARGGASAWVQVSAGGQDCADELQIVCAGRCAGAARALAELVADVAAFARAAARAAEAIWPTVAKLAATLARRCEEVPLARHFASRPLVEVLPPLMVAIIMGTIYFAFALCRAPLPGPGLAAAAWPQPWPLRGAAPAAFHGALLLAAASYHQGLVTDPGRIPDSWGDTPEAAARLARMQVAERKRTTGELRFCSKELKYKPDRAHYCSPLKRNVLRMDHYCPWMSNCIGYYNHKFFLLFLIYTVFAMLVAALGLAEALLRGFYSAGSTALIFSVGGLLVLLLSSLGPFLGLHLWLLSKNMTTIEFCERLGGHEDGYDSPYDIGLFGNFRSVFGPNMFLWLLPVGAPEGDGLQFPRRRPACVAAD